MLIHFEVPVRHLKLFRARPGFEPGTSRTLSENHTPRPTSQIVTDTQNTGWIWCIRLKMYAELFTVKLKFGKSEGDSICLNLIELQERPCKSWLLWKSKLTRACPGFEPGTSRTRSANHTPRPTSQLAYLLAEWFAFQDDNYQRNFIQPTLKLGMGSSGIWTRDLSHPKRESYP